MLLTVPVAKVTGKIDSNAKAMRSSAIKNARGVETAVRTARFRAHAATSSPTELRASLSTKNGWGVKELYRTTIRLVRIASTTISKQQGGAWHHDWAAPGEANCPSRQRQGVSRAGARLTPTSYAAPREARLRSVSVSSFLRKRMLWGVTSTSSSSSINSSACSSVWVIG